MLPPPADGTKLAALLAQLGRAVEELLLSGLTTASEATRQTLGATMQEAARFRLLRLAATLRTAGEELGRFTAHDPSFSRKRLTFFLSRAWLLSRGLAHALETANEAEFDRLTWSPPVQPLPKVSVACLGAAKKVATGTFVAFEFRFRVLADAPPVSAGQSLTWSVIFPIKADIHVPPEGFLHLPQKQKFAPFILLERKILTIENAGLVGEAPSARLTLNDGSTIAAGKGFKDWEPFLEWSPLPALQRLHQHTPGPLDLDTELQEEVVLHDYQIGAPEEGDVPGQTIYPISASNVSFSAVVGAEAEGKALRASLDGLRKLKRNHPPLYGLMHYERCRLAFQPLTAFRPEPDYLPISKENINKAALLKALKFT